MLIKGVIRPMGLIIQLHYMMQCECVLHVALWIRLGALGIE